VGRLLLCYAAPSARVWYYRAMVRAIVFDCFGVFYVDPVFAYMQDPSTPSSKAAALHDLDKQAARGFITKRDFVAQAAQLLQCSVVEIEERFFKGHVRNQQLLDFAQQARKTYKIALLSNIGSDMMDGFFTPKERAQLFDVVVLSGEVHMAKPDPEIFELTCNRLGAQPHEAVMIDDGQGHIDAAKRLGMQGIHYTSFNQCVSELKSILA